MSEHVNDAESEENEHSEKSRSIGRQIVDLIQVGVMIATMKGTNLKKLKKKNSEYWKPGDLLTPWTQFDPHPTYSQKEAYEAFEEQARDALGDSDGGIYIF
jgi:hypothetical protein